jgi:hypothetical protein
MLINFLHGLQLLFSKQRIFFNNPYHKMTQNINKLNSYIVNSNSLVLKIMISLFDFIFFNKKNPLNYQFELK